MDRRDAHFMDFIRSLERVKAEHGLNTDSLQEYQVNQLVKLERAFRKTLVRHPWGMDVYQHFVDSCKNILNARPYFRERDETFKSRISAALKAKDPVALTRFDINYQFIQFALRSKPWETDAAGRRLLKCAEKVLRLRQELVECNLPLAISQARTFFQRNQHSHLAFMDMNQECSMGLLEGVDKFVGPYQKNFRAVLIGRMLGNIIEANSQTFVHFFPADKMRLYRARKILRRLPRDQGPVDYDEVCRILNAQERERGEPLTTVPDIIAIIAASQVTSANTTLPDEEGEEESNGVDKYPADSDCRPDVLMEEAEARSVTGVAIETLPLVDRKLLRLRGVDLG